MYVAILLFLTGVLQASITVSYKSYAVTQYKSYEHGLGATNKPVPADSGVCSRYHMQVTELVVIFTINHFMFCTIPECSPFWQNVDPASDTVATRIPYQLNRLSALCSLNKSVLYIEIRLVCSPLSKIKINFAG